jgi:hypothetical protein
VVECNDRAVLPKAGVQMKMNVGRNGSNGLRQDQYHSASPNPEDPQPELRTPPLEFVEFPPLPRDSILAPPCAGGLHRKSRPLFPWSAVFRGSDLHSRQSAPAAPAAVSRTNADRVPSRKAGWPTQLRRRPLRQCLVEHSSSRRKLRWVQPVAAAECLRSSRFSLPPASMRELARTCKEADIAGFGTRRPIEAETSTEGMP